MVRVASRWQLVREKFRQLGPALAVVIRTTVETQFQVCRERKLAARREAVGHDLLEEVNRARREWLQAQNYFEWVTSPEEIEHAAFWVKEAERKYILLWEQARRLQAAAWSCGKKCNNRIAAPRDRWYNHAGLSYPAPTERLEPLVQGEEVKPGAPV